MKSDLKKGVFAVCGVVTVLIICVGLFFESFYTLDPAQKAVKEGERIKAYVNSYSGFRAKAKILTDGDYPQKITFDITAKKDYALVQITSPQELCGLSLQMEDTGVKFLYKSAEYRLSGLYDESILNALCVFPYMFMEAIPDEFCTVQDIKNGDAHYIEFSWRQDDITLKALFEARDSAPKEINVNCKGIMLDIIIDDFVYV